LATALCVYPIAQLAYHLYVAYHAPAVRVGPDLVAISAALSFAPGGVFDIDSTFTAFCVAHHSAINEHILFDSTSCVANIIKALSRVKGQVIEIYEHKDDDHPKKRWTGFVNRQERELQERRNAAGNGLAYTAAELRDLVREIRLFGSVMRKEQHNTAHMLTLTPIGGGTHAAPSGSSAIGHAPVIPPRTRLTSLTASSTPLTSSAAPCDCLIQRLQPSWQS
jgi:hypothetical protein